MVKTQRYDGSKAGTVGIVTRLTHQVCKELVSPHTLSRARLKTDVRGDVEIASNNGTSLRTYNAGRDGGNSAPLAIEPVSPIC